MSELDLQKRNMLLEEFLKGSSLNEASDKIAKCLGKKGFSIRNCQRWYKKFKTGDLDLTQRPVCETQRPVCETQRPVCERPKRSTHKELKADTLSLKNDSKRQGTQTTDSTIKNDALQKLVEKKSELTISKVISGSLPVAQNGAAKQNIQSKRLIGPTTYKIASTKPAFRRQSFMAANAPPSRFNVRLPLNIAKRLQTAKTSMERHSIGQKTGELIKKPITVQFQNLSPDLAKNTVRKVVEKTSTPLNATKRLAIPQLTPLSLPKGVIYLNPQEIFKQNYGFKNTVKNSIQDSLLSKPVRNLPKTIPPVCPPHSSQSPMTVSESDSDSEDDVVFPEDVSLPAPKMKAVTDTFTTYWDMETDMPILLNPTECVTPPPPPVIEID